MIGTETLVRQYDVHAGQSFAPEIPAVPYLDVLGTANSKNGDVSLFVVNRNPKSSQPVAIHLSGFTPLPDVRVVTLATPSLVDNNDEEHQNTVRPVESHDLMEGTTIRHVLPAGSVTVFSFSGPRKE